MSALPPALPGKPFEADEKVKDPDLKREMGLMLNAVFVYALSAQEMSGAMEVGAESAHALFGPRMGRFFSAAVSLCLLSVLSAMIMAGPRVYYAMARDGVFISWFGKINRKRGTPTRSICLQAAIAILMVLT